VAGWLGRTDDLLAASAPEPKAMPGLWIAPAWSSLPRQNSAEDQYIEAQLRAPKDEMEAAWVAVPGHFPAYREWASRAYTQLARLLLRRHDAERLQALADEIERWEGAQTHEKELAHIARTGAQALQNDLDGVLRSLNKSVFDAGKITDPALLELCLEVTTQAEHVASRPGGTTSLPLVRPELRQIQVEMIRKLYQAEPHEPVPAAPKSAETGERPVTKKAVRRPNVNP
jgi:serine/threonine-protein kinase